MHHDCCIARLSPRSQTLVVIALLLVAAGCKPAATPPTAAPAASNTQKTPLRVLVIDDVQLGDAISRQWQSRTESEINVEHATSAEISQAKRLPADVVVFPSPLLGQLAERGLIAPLPDAAVRGTEFDERDLLGQVRLSEIRWGHKVAAVPLGSPQLLLVYRADLFNDLQLHPPETWDEYQALVDRLRDPVVAEKLDRSDDQEWQAAAEPLAPGWAGRLLLARAASYVTHRDQVASLFHPDSMTPLIDSPPFVRALEELVSANATSPGRFTAAEVVEQILAGKAAIGIGFPEAIASNRSKGMVETRQKLTFAPLPGSREAFNFPVGQWETRRDDEEPRAALIGIPGRQAAISSSARQSEAAVNFLVWLSSSDISSRASSSSAATAPFRKSQLNETGRWLGLAPDSGQSCAAALERSLSQKRGVMVPRIAGQEQYLAALDDAVEAALSKQQTPADALKDAAAQWQKITDSLGREQQQLVYRRSLNVADWP